MEAPRRTPSVLTFMALFSLTTSNLLNRNMLIFSKKHDLKTIKILIINRLSDSDKLPVHHEERTVAHRRQVGIMRHYDYGLIVFVTQIEEQTVEFLLGL